MLKRWFKLFILISISYLITLSSVIAEENLFTVCLVQNYNSPDLLYPLNYYPQLAYSNTFVFNPRTLRWTAYGNSGQVVNSGKASGGKHYCSDIGRSCRTITGRFRVHSKGGPGCKSSRYPLPHGGAPMPYCAYFTKYYAVHGSYEVPHYNASHGCVRVTPAAARWLHYNFLKIGTPIIVLPY